MQHFRLKATRGSRIFLPFDRVLTSLSAIIGLWAAMTWDLVFVDSIAALVSSLVIIKWSVGLLKESGKSLLDMEKEDNNRH